MSGEGMLERGVRSRVGHLKGTGRGRKGRRTAGEARMQEKGKKVCAEEVEERYPRERRQSQVSAVPASSLPTEPDPLLSFKVQRSDGRPASPRQSQPDQIPSKSKSPSPTASDTSSSPRDQATTEYTTPIPLAARDKPRTQTPTRCPLSRRRIPQAQNSHHHPHLPLSTRCRVPTLGCPDPQGCFCSTLRPYQTPLPRPTPPHSLAALARSVGLTSVEPYETP